jgi:hypothetical protein
LTRKYLRSAIYSTGQSKHYRDARAETFALHDAQLVIARAYGFESWPRLKAHVDGLTAKQFISAVRDNDGEKVCRDAEVAARSRERAMALRR